MIFYLILDYVNVASSLITMNLFLYNRKVIHNLVRKAYFDSQRK